MAVAGTWLGLVLTMLVLGVAARAPAMGVATTYRLMRLIGGTVIPPLAVVTLVTGVALSLLTPWGLVRHWWVVVKAALSIGVILTAVSLTDGWLRQAVATPAEAGALGDRLVVTSALHLAMLGFATVISVDKPWGRTPRGRRAAAGGRRREGA